MRDELFKNFEQGTQPATSSLEPNAQPSDVGGLPNSGGEVRAIADWDDMPKFGATTNYGPPTNLPDSVDGSTLVREGLRRCENVLSPADREVGDE